MDYVTPKLDETAFHCPYCNSYAHQHWSGLYIQNEDSYYNDQNDFKISKCKRCKNLTLWFSDKIIYPDFSGIPPPNQDLNEDIKRDYLEAGSIVHKSPRGASALLRLAIQKLCVQLGESGENLNDDIGNLVKKGLSPTIQQALDSVRVIGNEAVHPGELDLENNKEITIKLFNLINIIAQVMITQPKEIKEIYESLPDKKVNGIGKRDNK